MPIIIEEFNLMGLCAENIKTIVNLIDIRKFDSKFIKRALYKYVASFLSKDNNFITKQPAMKAKNLCKNLIQNYQLNSRSTLCKMIKKQNF